MWGTWFSRIGMIMVFVGLGHSVLAMSGEESLAQVYREIESPKLPNLKKDGSRHFHLQPGLYFARLHLCGDDHPRRPAPQLLREPYRRPRDESLRTLRPPAAVSRLRGDRRRGDPGRSGEHRHRWLEWRPQPRFRRWRASGLVPPAPQALWHHAPPDQWRRVFPDSHHHHQPRPSGFSRQPLCLWRDLELHHEGHRGAGAALHAPGPSRIPRPHELQNRRRGNPAWSGADHACALLHRDREPLHQAASHDCRRQFFVWTLSRLHHFGKSPAPPAPRRTRGDGSVQSRAGRRANT